MCQNGDGSSLDLKMNMMGLEKIVNLKGGLCFLNLAEGMTAKIVLWVPVSSQNIKTYD
jgi:hypothetical protein